MIVLIKFKPMAEMSLADETKAHGIYCFFETINSYFITYSETNNKQVFYWYFIGFSSNN